jgi:hypothetical protein
MVQARTTDTHAIISMTLRQFLWVIAAGAAVGVTAWLFGQLLSAWLFTPLFCRTGSSVCSQVSQYANVGALILATGLGVFLLVRAQVYRPLLTGLGAALTLWGVLDMVHPLAWYQGIFIMALLFALAYGAFTWLARIRAFLIAVIISVVVLIIVRYILTT